MQAIEHWLDEAAAAVDLVGGSGDQRGKIARPRNGVDWAQIIHQASYGVAVDAIRTSGEQTLQWLSRGAVREDGRLQASLVSAQMVPQEPFQNSAQVGGRLQIALLQEVGVFDARPIGDDAAAFERAAGEQRDG